MFQLRYLLLALCIVAMYFLSTIEMVTQVPSIDDLPEIATIKDKAKVTVTITVADDHHAFNTVPTAQKATPTTHDTCDTLDIQQAQITELQTACSEEERKLMDDTMHYNNNSSNYIIMCNVKPIDKNDHNTTLILPKANGKLRHDWSFHKPLSRFAKAIEAHQSNCTLPVATYHIDNLFGIGSHVALWSQAICNSMEAGTRLRTYNPIWLWMDQTFCSMETAEKSPLLCYMPGSEFQCGCDEVPPNFNVSDPRDIKRTQCALLKGQGQDILREFRAATTEFLLHRISPLVIKEAERQVGLLFGPEGTPDDLMTVHIRWGDKFWEMPNRTLIAVQGYMDAISTVLHEQFGHNRTANIYLATEDPRAYQEFRNATPPGWNVYYDRTVMELDRFRPPKGNRASHTAKNTKGRAGLAGFASLLVAMEAKLFVLTTTSNWSRIMDHLRKNVIDPRCNGCTKMVDLVAGVW